MEFQDWIGSNRKTGTRFSWIQKDTKTARDAVSSIQEKFGAVPDTDHRWVYFSKFLIE